MLRIASQLSGLAIGSLHAGYRIGTIGDPIINPHKFRIEAFYCEGAQLEPNVALLTQDIREFTATGLLIDHEEDLAPIRDLIRLQDLIEINFKLVGKKVYTEHSHTSLGKVSDYVINDSDFRIEKLYVQRPAWKSLMTSQLIIARSQIVKATDSRIIVKDGVTKLTETQKPPVPQPKTAI